jgi:hypothetical protein
LTLTRAWLVLLLLSGCSHDFGSFMFGARRDGGARSRTRDASQPDAAMLPDAQSAGDASDAGGSRATDSAVLDAASDAGGSGAPDSGGRDSGMDGAVKAGPDGGDASGPDPAACTAAWSATPPGSDSCSKCACDSCTATVLACLTQGSASAQMLCEAVLACSIQNDCGDSCYCGSNGQCGQPNPDGNGPCVVQMNAAAGGSRDRVNQIIAADDPTQPLARAIDALRCMFGTGRRGSGPCQPACP